jgi:hypothetical protein
LYKKSAQQRERSGHVELAYLAEGTAKTVVFLSGDESEMTRKKELCGTL